MESEIENIPAGEIDYEEEPAGEKPVYEDEPVVAKLVNLLENLKKSGFSAAES